MKRITKILIWLILIAIIIIALFFSIDIAKLKSILIESKLIGSTAGELLDSLTTYFVLLTVMAVAFGILHIFNMLAHRFDLSESFGLKKKIHNQQIVDKMIKVNEFDSQIVDENFNELKEEIALYLKKANSDSNGILSILAEKLKLVQAEIYLKKTISDDKIKLAYNYAFYNPEGKHLEFEVGEGLIGQVVKNGIPLNLDNVPEGYVTVISGLGKTTPQNLLIIPITIDSDNVGIIEIASFSKFSKSLTATMVELGQLYGNYLIEKNIISQD